MAEERREQENILREIAKAIGNNSKLVDLGLQLKIDYQKIDDYRAMNRREQDYSGTTKMLVNWGAVHKNDWQNELWDALDRAGLVSVAEEHLQQPNQQPVRGVRMNQNLN